MLGTTLTIIPNGVGGTGIVLNRVRDDGYGAEYYRRDNDGSFRVIIRHSSSKGRDRHYVEVQREVFATPTTEAWTAKSSFVLETPPAFATSAKYNAALPLTALLGYSASTDAVLTGLIGWDS